MPDTIADTGNSSAASVMFIGHAPDWLGAVARRHSRRVFDGKPVATELLSAIDAVCAGFTPYTDARVILVRESALDVFTGIAGSYGKVRKAPHVLVFAGQDRSPYADQHVGFMGEAVVLESTALGLDTCWIGGFFSADRVRRIVNLAPGERVYAVSPLGNAEASKSIAEKAMRGLAGSGKRKCVEEIAPGIGAAWPTWAIAAVETARLAPSAVNRQPWRFRFEDGGLVVAKDSAFETPKVTKRLDCGIAMLHAELGALSSGVRGVWTDLRGTDIARYDVSSPGQ